MTNLQLFWKKVSYENSKNSAQSKLEVYGVVYILVTFRSKNVMCHRKVVAKKGIMLGKLTDL